MLFSYLGFDPFHTEKVTDVFDTKTTPGRDAMQNRCHVAKILRAAKSAIQDACLASIFLFFPSFLSERSEVFLLLAYFVMSILARSRHTHTITLHKSRMRTIYYNPGLLGLLPTQYAWLYISSCEIPKQTESKCNPSN